MSSLRSKMIVLLTGITLVTALVLTINSVSTFKKDKIAYIFENNSLIIQTSAEKFRREIALSTEIIRTHLANYTQTGTINLLGAPHLPDEYLVDGLELFQFDVATGRYSRTQSLIKTKLANPLIPQEGNEVSIFFAPNEKQKVIFKNNYLILKETVTSASGQYVVFYYYEPESLQSLFQAENPYSTFIVKGNGVVLKTTDGISTDYLQQEFTFLNDREDLLRTLNSATTKMASKTGESWLISSVALGFSELHLLTLVNEERALSVLDRFYIQSVFMFTLITAVVVILGLLAATYLTGRLSTLSSATEKISDGDFTVQVDENGKDEIATLSSRFNKMAKQIIVLMQETAEKARMESELKTAQTVQSTLFPKTTTTYGQLRISGVYKSASECGGDWWHHAEVGDFVWIWIADATGHGVPAALLTSAAKSAVTLIEGMNLEPASAIDYMNRSICGVSNGQMMMTCFVAQIHKKNLTMKYVNASHEAPIILRGEGDLKKKDLIFLTEAPGARLGQSPSSQYVMSEVQLEPGDRLLLYSDGIPDIRTPANESLGERGFIRTLLSSQNKHLEFFEFAHDFHNQLEQYRQKTELVDDVTYCFVELNREL